MTTKEQILQQLRRRPSTLTALSAYLHKSPDGLRGRISELRKQGHPIQRKNNHYILHDISIPKNKIIQYLESNNHYNKQINYSTLSKELNLSLTDIETAFAQLFTNYHIIQTSKTSCIIQKI